MEEEFTLADVARRSGANRRAVQVWGDAQVLRCVSHPGTGHRRLFAEAEVEIAALLAPFARAGITIGRLVQIAESIRLLRGERTVADIYRVQESAVATRPLVVRISRTKVVVAISPLFSPHGDELVLAVDARRILTTAPYREETT